MAVDAIGLLPSFGVSWQPIRRLQEMVESGNHCDGAGYVVGQSESRCDFVAKMRDVRGLWQLIWQSIRIRQFEFGNSNSPIQIPCSFSGDLCHFYPARAALWIKIR